MQINSLGFHSQSSVQQSQARNAVGGGPSSTLASTLQGTGESKPDVQFGDMTRKELREWMDTQVRAGELTLDEAAPFAFMTMKIPVSGGAEVPVADDSERVDYLKRAREGIDGARERGDQTTLKMLTRALEVMTTFHKRSASIDFTV